VIRVYDEADDAIEMHEQAGGFREGEPHLALAMFARAKAATCACRIPSSLVSRCYGSGAPGRKFFEDIVHSVPLFYSEQSDMFKRTWRTRLFRPSPIQGIYH
jgi:hypothetical protein